MYFELFMAICGLIVACCAIICANESCAQTKLVKKRLEAVEQVSIQLKQLISQDTSKPVKPIETTSPQYDAHLIKLPRYSSNMSAQQIATYQLFGITYTKYQMPSRTCALSDIYIRDDVSLDDVRAALQTL